MASMKFNIELSVQGIDSPERMQALTDALKDAGRQLFAASVLIIGDGPTPKIELSAEDLTDGRQEISVDPA